MQPENPVGELAFGEFEQFVVHIEENNETIILHESETLPHTIRVDA